ncbi:MAG: acyl-CoA carboxylase subunit epsilon [Frankiaceae bacterium]
MSDGSETNDLAVSEDAAAQPHIQILKGHPTHAELAALVAVLGSAGGAPEPAQPERTRWGLPIDHLRFAMSNYQRLTMQQMMHMKQ